MASSGVPAVPCTRSVESPEMAAARCSETQDLAVPGTPRSNNARSVTRVATATSINRREPTYFGLIIVPSDNGPPIRYRTTAQGDSRQCGGRGWSSTCSKAASSWAYSCSACGRSCSLIDLGCRRGSASRDTRCLRSVNVFRAASKALVTSGVVLLDDPLWHPATAGQLDLVG